MQQFPLLPNTARNTDVLALAYPTLLFIATGFAVVWGLISKLIVGYWLENFPRR